MRVDNKGNSTIGRHFERLLVLVKRNINALDEMDKEIYHSEHQWYYSDVGGKGKAGEL